MHQFESLQLFLWILAPAGQLITAALILKRRLTQEVPWFFAYTIFHLIQFALLFGAYHYTYSTYFYSYWITEGIDALLVLVVIQEIYDRDFRSFRALRDLSTNLFRWAVIILLAISLLVAVSTSGTERDRLIASLLVLDRSASFVQCVVILLLFGLKQALGIPWRNLNHGIALGFGVVSTFACAGFTVRSYSHRAIDGMLGLLFGITYDLAIAVWIGILLRPEPTLDDVRLGLASAKLQKWDSALLDLRNG
jgi:hypothetical protein